MQKTPFAYAECLALYFPFSATAALRWSSQCNRQSAALHWFWLLFGLPVSQGCSNKLWKPTFLDHMVEKWSGSIVVCLFYWLQNLCNFNCFANCVASLYKISTERKNHLFLTNAHVLAMKCLLWKNPTLFCTVSWKMFCAFSNMPVLSELLNFYVFISRILLITPKDDAVWAHISFFFYKFSRVTLLFLY